MKTGQKTLIGSSAGEVAGPWATSDRLHLTKRLGTRAWLAWIIAATFAFIQPLSELMLESSQSEFYSYIPLVPILTGYLLWTRRRSLNAEYRSSIVWGGVLAGVAAAVLAVNFSSGASLSVNDRHALLTLAYLCVIAGGGFLCVGSQWMTTAAFPLAFLIFLIPLPDVAVRWLETASVLASADAAAFLFRITDTPLVRDGAIFMLPGIVLQVAQECSGIHSSWVLFITSLVASQLFLDSPWRRVALVAFVIPLAIVRNAVRIVTIGLLCVHIGPHMIHSIVHRRGGPFFFALSLGPLFLLLVWLRRQER